MLLDAKWRVKNPFSTIKQEVESLENLLGRGERRVFSKCSQLSKDGVGKVLFASMLLVTDLFL